MAIAFTPSRTAGEAEDRLAQASRFLSSDEAFQVVDEARELVAVSGDPAWLER